MKWNNYIVILAFITLLGINTCTTFNPPTYSNSIASIIYKNCTPCHRPNQIGHFNLLNYTDVVNKKDAILLTVKQRLMPPWPADIHYSRFLNEMVLEDDEINKIETWIKNNCPIGDSNNIPALPNYPKGSFIGQPDLTLAVPPQAIQSNYADKFLMIKVPFELPAETYVHTIEIMPGNTKVVHHVNAGLIRYDDAKKKNVYDGTWVHNTVNDSTKVNAYKQMGLLHDDGSFPILRRSVANYLPGVITPIYPPGIGDVKLGKKNALLLNDMHYGPYWENTTDSTYINLFFSKAPPQRPVQEFIMGTLGISACEPPLVIPPDSIVKISTKYTLPSAISIITINPHMHLIGKQFWSFATKPNGDTIPIIRIPNWNFNWQNFYTPAKPIVLSAGCTIYAIGVYDNTANNPFNPNKPPKTITDKDASMKTTDEMFQLIISYMDYKPNDENLSLK
jgi:hypothetical protein